MQLRVVGRLSAQTVVHYVDAAFERLVFVLHFFIGLVQVFEIPPVVLVNHLGQVRLQQARGAGPVACLAAEPVQDPLPRLVYKRRARGLRVSVGLLLLECGLGTIIKSQGLQTRNCLHKELVLRVGVWGVQVVLFVGVGFVEVSLRLALGRTGGF